MAKEIFRYTIHRTGVKRALVRGEIRKKTIVQAIKTLQRRIRKTVTKQKIAVYLRVWNTEDETDKFEKQYSDKRDFRQFRKPPKWRQKISRQAKYSSTYDPTPTAWFVAIGKRGQVDLTKLAYEPTKQSLLRKKRKRLIGPFESEDAARAFAEKVKAKIDGESSTEFTQHRRYKGV